MKCFMWNIKVFNLLSEIYDKNFFLAYIFFKYYLAENIDNMDNININLPTPANFFVIFSRLPPFAAYRNMWRLRYQYLTNPDPATFYKLTHREKIHKISANSNSA